MPSICPQFPPDMFDSAIQGGPVYSENCLHLNMWIPIEKPPERGWPVYFYIRQCSPLPSDLPKMI